MSLPPGPPAATVHHILTRVPHVVRTAQVRDDLVGWVLSGHKQLSTPRGATRIASGQVFLIPRATQWDMQNEPMAGGHYQARLISFTPQLVELFHERFGQFAATPALQGCMGTPADEPFASSFNHAVASLQDPESSDAVRQHRALEVLLVLAERGLVFAPARELSWTDRVQRLVGQRPHAAWTVDDLARAFHLSASTLQRRLADEGTTASQCVRDVRLEAALALLQGSSLQVSEISARCGYDSHSRFSAAFRKRFGFAPSHLRP
jgi:AraC-like DNA-binding protein